MKCPRFFHLVVFVGLLLPLAAHASTKTRFNAKDINRVVEVGDPEISSNGEWIAYTVTTTDYKNDEYVSRLWRVGFDGGDRAQFLDAPGASSWHAQWFNKGKSIAFLRYSSDGEEDAKEAATQVWVMTADGGQAHQVTHFPSGVKDFVVSPDDKRLAVIALDPKYPPGTKKPSTPPPFVTHRYLFKDDSQGWLGQRYKHLYIVDVATGESVQITHGDHNETLPSWSPDGSQLAFVSRRYLYPEHIPNYHVYLIDAHAGAKATQLTTKSGDDLDPYWGSRPAWSPDGKRIAYLHGRGGKWFDYAPPQLAVINVRTGKSRMVAPIDRWFQYPTWSADGRTVYGVVTQAESAHLVKVEVSSGKVTPLTHGNRLDVGLSMSQSGHIVVLGGDDLHPYTLYALNGGHLRTLVNHNKWLKGKKLVTSETIRFKSRDGTENIHALLVKPVGYEKGKRYPMIVNLHGGPVYQFSHEFMSEWQVYAANGYVVLGVNPRGSSGRGFEFAKAIYADWGNKDTQDVLAAVDYVVNQLKVADPDHLGVAGWSYGGILTNQVIARTHIFDAAISGAGSGNMYGMYGADQYAIDYELELGVPWEKKNRPVWDRVSYPFLHADKIVTPTMFQCGEKDFNVPCIGSEQMYQALRSVGVPSVLVVYPNQHHGFTTPSYVLDRMQRDLEWFNRYLKKMSDAE